MTTPAPGHVPPRTHHVALPGTEVGPTFTMPEPSRSPVTYAGLGLRITSRVLGVVLGIAVWLIVRLLLGLALDPVLASVGAAVVSLAFGLYQWAMLATRGWTLERRWLGIRVLKAEALSPPGFGTALVRELLLSVASVPTLGIGALITAVVAARDERRQGWHDKVAGTLVVQASSFERTGTPAEGHARSGMTLPPPPTPSSVTAPPPQGIITGPGQVAPRPAVDRGVELTSHAAAPVPPPPSLLVAPAPPAPPSAPDAVEHETIARSPAARAWRLSLPGGAVEILARSVVVGRDPVAAGDPSARLLPVDDPTSSVSKTHARFWISEESAWVEDLNSTNGVVIARNDGDHEIPPGARGKLSDGDEVYLGEFLVRVECGPWGLVPMDD